MVITTAHTVLHQHTKITKNTNCCLEKYVIWRVHNLTRCTKFFTVYLEIRCSNTYTKYEQVTGSYIT